jgi:hypothetical protein
MGEGIMEKAIEERRLRFLTITGYWFLLTPIP